MLTLTRPQQFVFCWFYRYLNSDSYSQESGCFYCNESFFRDYEQLMMEHMRKTNAMMKLCLMNCHVANLRYYSKHSSVNFIIHLRYNLFLDFFVITICLCILKVFVLSEVGKPIFASCGHEEQLCSLIALIQTFVMVVTSWNDSLKRIRSAHMQISFSYRSPLILCIVSRDGFQLDAQVDLVYKQVIFLSPLI